MNSKWWWSPLKILTDLKVEKHSYRPIFTFWWRQVCSFEIVSFLIEISILSHKSLHKIIWKIFSGIVWKKMEYPERNRFVLWNLECFQRNFHPFLLIFELYVRTWKLVVQPDFSSTFLHYWTYSKVPISPTYFSFKAMKKENQSTFLHRWRWSYSLYYRSNDYFLRLKSHLFIIRSKKSKVMISIPFSMLIIHIEKSKLLPPDILIDKVKVHNSCDDRGLVFLIKTSEVTPVTPGMSTLDTS